MHNFSAISTKRGSILIQIIAFMAIGIFIFTGFVGWGMMSIRAARHAEYREQAIEIAEAGIDYYRWHLAHAAADFQDGTGSAGPYVHSFIDKAGNIIGSYTLTITAPPVGSTYVTIRSTGKVLVDPTVSRTVQVQLGKPSYAKYAAVTNAPVYYGSGDNVSGPIHANQGVGFFSGSPQPIAHGLVTSAVATTTWSGTRYGVFTTVATADPSPPVGAVAANPHADVFLGGRQYPVPAVDFTGLLADMSSLRTNSIGSGLHFNASGLGHFMVVKTNGTFDLYTVNTLSTPPAGCKDPHSYSGWSSIPADPNWGSWSIATKSAAVNYAFPANGIVFFEDNLWVEGTISNQHVTVVSANNIIVNHSLLYANGTSTSSTGSEAIGLIAQNNFFVGMITDDKLEIDAAIMAQTGGSYRPYYRRGASYCTDTYAIRSALITWGMYAVYGSAYFYSDYGSGYISGFTLQPAAYDTFLLYGPPPSFPLTTDKYQIISWKEI